MKIFLQRKFPDLQYVAVTGRKVITVLPYPWGQYVAVSFLWGGGGSTHPLIRYYETQNLPLWPCETNLGPTWPLSMGHSPICTCKIPGSDQHKMKAAQASLSTTEQEDSYLLPMRILQQYMKQAKGLYL